MYFMTQEAYVSACTVNLKIFWRDEAIYLNYASNLSAHVEGRSSYLKPYQHITIISLCFLYFKYNIYNVKYIFYCVLFLSMVSANSAWYTRRSLEDM